MYMYGGQWLFFLAALQVQKSSLEQVSKDKVEQMLKETEAKYQRELAENVIRSKLVIRTPLILLSGRKNSS